MTNIQTNYQALLPLTDEEADCERKPQETGGVIFHVTPESGKSRWSHIEDLDSFFRKRYHQKHGFLCMVTSDIYEFVTLPFLVLGFIYFLNCVGFDYYAPANANSTSVEKRYLSDLLSSPAVCFRRLHFTYWIVIAGLCVICIYKLIKLLYNFIDLVNIQDFYASALKISSSDLENITWHEVQCKLREFQHEHQMCVHAKDLTELDIYHRILRQTNYMIAMVNKNILPIKYKLPYFGDVIYFPSGLMNNLHFLLFWSPFSPFKSTWQLKDDYKKYQKRKELADWLSKCILLIGIGNAVVIPISLMWRFLTLLFSYASILKGEFSTLCARRWSEYSKLYLRHFNELEHEYESRLNRAYKPSMQYMNCFWSHLTVIHARYFASIFGCIVFVLALWTFIDERMLQVDHVILVTYVSHRIYEATVKQLPDENLVILPETLMNRILADIHYVPDHWKGRAHAKDVKDEFAQLFPLSFVVIFEEMLCPILTPFIMIFHLRHRSLDIVDFFRSFTVDVVGVGDVCSFALMDVSKHGHHHWNTYAQGMTDQYQEAEHGKIELSLMHFTVTNPLWKPPPSSNAFINKLREHGVQYDTQRLHDDRYRNALHNSLRTMQELGSTHAALANSYLRSSSTARSINNQSLLIMSNERISDVSNVSPVHARGFGVIKAEGPMCSTDVAMLNSLIADSSDKHGAIDVNPLEYRVANMSFNTLYLHSLHQQHLNPENAVSQVFDQSSQEQQLETTDENQFSDETYPLLRASQ